MTWYGLHDAAGDLVSTMGDDCQNPDCPHRESFYAGDDAYADLGLTVIPLAEQPRFDRVEWNPLTRAFANRPSPEAPTPLPELVVQQPEVAAFSDTAKEAVKAAVERAVGRRDEE